MPKIEVLHLVEDLKIGGMERVISAIAGGLDKDRFNVNVWCMSRGGDIFEELVRSGIKAEILGMRSDKDILFLLKLCWKMIRGNIYVLHTHGYPASTLGRLMAVFAGIPVIVSHVHSTYWDYTRKQIFIERFLSGCTDKIICCSRAVADFVTGQEGISPKKVKVIYNGVRGENIGLEDRSQSAEKNEFLVGCVASLVAHKGHKYLLEAAAYVKNNFRPKVKFILAGDGVLRKELEEYARKLGLAQEVEFRGVVGDIPRLLDSLDVVALVSSEREGLGIALLEAMAAGKPVIGTRVGGIPEVIRDGENGLLVAPQDSPALAKAIISLLEDSQKAKAMGGRGRTMVKESFSLPGMIKRIEDLYQDLIDAKLNQAKT